MREAYDSDLEASWKVYLYRQDAWQRYYEMMDCGYDEGRPPILYHGTLRVWLPRIRREGLKPKLGDNSRTAYLGKRLRGLLFAGQSALLSFIAIAAQIGIRKGDMTSVSMKEVIDQGVICELPSIGFQRRLSGEEDGHPTHVEECDYYTRNTVRPVRYWTKLETRNFFRDEERRWLMAHVISAWGTRNDRLRKMKLSRRR